MFSQRRRFSGVVRQTLPRNKPGFPSCSYSDFTTSRKSPITNPEVGPRPHRKCPKCLALLKTAKRFEVGIGAGGVTSGKGTACNFGRTRVSDTNPPANDRIGAAAGHTSCEVDEETPGPGEAAAQGHGGGGAPAACIQGSLPIPGNLRGHDGSTGGAPHWSHAPGQSSKAETVPVPFPKLPLPHWDPPLPLPLPFSGEGLYFPPPLEVHAGVLCPEPLHVPHFGPVLSSPAPYGDGHTLAGWASPRQLYQATGGRGSPLALPLPLPKWSMCHCPSWAVGSQGGPSRDPEN